MKKCKITSKSKTQDSKGLNRRNFMVKTALLGAGLTSATFACSNANTPSNESAESEEPLQNSIKKS